MTNFLTGTFHHVGNWEMFERAVHDLARAVATTNGLFVSDNLITFSRVLGFLEDPAFLAAFDKNNAGDLERGIIWRTHTLCWAARQVSALPGDFVEAGCYQGFSARIVCDYVGLGPSRKYWLYDLFRHDDDMPHDRFPEHGEHLEARVRARFADLPRVRIVSGHLPDTLAENSPDSIALLHLDLNHAATEVAVLERLYERLLPGGIVLLDDYGWLGYREQHDAERSWFEAKGKSILELPTGQGLVIK